MTRLNVYACFRQPLITALVIILSIGFLSTRAFASQNDTATTNQQLNFTVYYDSKPIGEHKFEIQRSGERIQVNSNVFMNIKVLFIKVFGYQHSATEQWQNGCLMQASSNTRENSRRIQLDITKLPTNVEVARREDGASNVQVLPAPDCLRAYAYWDPSLLQGQLINIQEGDIGESSLTPLGLQTLPAPMDTLMAESKMLTVNDTEIQLWYSDSGEFLALATEARGSPLTYLNTRL